MFDSVDIFTSRRRHFEECYYWKKNDREIEMNEDLYSMVSVDPETSEMCYEREPNGSFMAAEISSYDRNNQFVGGSFVVDENYVTLETNDFLPELTVNDIVVFNKYVWRITSVSRAKRKRQTQFANDIAYKTYISLKRYGGLIMKIDTKNILCIISNQIADIINDDEQNYYSDLNVEIKEEFMFLGEDEEESPNTIYVTVKFLPASIDYGQTAIPITFEIMSEQNDLERTRTLFNEYASRYNLVWNEDRTMQQTYEIPSVVDSFNEVYEGFRTVLTMPGAVLLMENGNDCVIQYYPNLVIDEEKNIIYLDKNNNDITKERNPKIDIEVFKSALTAYNKEYEKNVAFGNGSKFELNYNGYSWGLTEKNSGEKIDSITIYDYGINFDGIANQGDSMTFSITKGYSDLEFIAINSQASISLDSQAFYNNDGFTVSKGKFGSFSINLTAYLFDNYFLNKCLAIYLRNLDKEPLGIDTPFDFKIKFKSGHSLTTQFKMADFSLQLRKGQLPIVSITFTE